MLEPLKLCCIIYTLVSLIDFIAHHSALKALVGVLTNVWNRNEQLLPNAQTPQTGTVIITDAAFGTAREIAHVLTRQGFHVLAGVNTDIEARSFAYDQHKGFVVFDFITLYYLP